MSFAMPKRQHESQMTEFTVSDDKYVNNKLTDVPLVQFHDRLSLV